MAMNHANLTSSLHKQQGFLMIVAVLLIMVVGFIGLAVTYMLAGSANSSTNETLATKAFYLAESGLEQATHKLQTITLTNRIACSGLSINNSLAAGVYAVTATGPTYVSSPTTLNGTLSASATSITVGSTANYQSSGRIMIDRELINYGSVDTTHFLGVTRGVDGSVATTHTSGTTAGQFQCSLYSQGGVPTLSAPASPGDPSGKRLLQDKVQLQEAWAVGNVNSGNFTLARWNKPTEVSWNSAVTSGSNTLNSVSMLSYTDGWAVGQNGNFLHWNGNTWALTTVSPTAQYNSVFCNASNDCHAVGNTSAPGNSTTLMYWNGSTWARLTPGGVADKNNLNSVHCDASNDCWTVGAKSNGTFYYWNGTSWAGVNTSTLTAYPYTGVFCNSPTDCWAVGNNATFARKNGASWGNLATGLPSAQYNSVFCNSSSDCWAVGNTNGGRDLIAHWNGSAWSRDAGNPTPIAGLNSVVCATAKDCWAVGTTNSGGNPAFVHWDGSTWMQFSTSGLPNVSMNGVAIVSPNNQPRAGWVENFG